MATASIHHYFDNGMLNRPKPRLMIVEDDPDLRVLIDLAANRAEAFAGVTTEADGEVALAKIRQQTEGMDAGNRPDIVFTDLDMPGMNGIQLTRELQRNEKTRDIRVAVFTASNIPNDNAAARAAGCCAVFKKPLGLNELTAIMKSLPTMWAGTVER
jgi:CheY-like chemotaxis protein